MHNTIGQGGGRDDDEEGDEDDDEEGGGEDDQGVAKTPEETLRSLWRRVTASGPDTSNIPAEMKYNVRGKPFSPELDCKDHVLKIVNEKVSFSNHAYIEGFVKYIALHKEVLMCVCVCACVCVCVCVCMCVYCLV